MKKTPSKIRKVLIPAIVMAFVLVPLLGAPAGAAVTIRAAFVSNIANGLNPADTAWNAAILYTVPLDSIIGPTGIPQRLPSSKWRYLKVKAVHNGTDIFFRYEWLDSTVSDSVADAPLFADAVAMEIPLVNPSTIAMGNQREPVNILYWRADMGDPATGLGHPQNIIAGGAGTVQTSPDSDLLPISHFQGRTNGGWTVIFKRPLVNASANGNMVALARNKYYRICFAQWDGANEERNGLKMVAGSWQTLFVQ